MSKQTARCESLVDGLLCMTPLHFDTDHLGRLRAHCPACAGQCARPAYRPEPLPKTAKERKYNGGKTKLTAEQGKALAALAFEIGTKLAAAKFGVGIKMTQKYRREHHGYTYQGCQR